MVSIKVYKEYKEFSGKLYFKNTHMYELLELGRCKADVEIETLMIVDSLEMTDTVCNYVIQKSNKKPIKQIVITHGTETIVEAAH